MGMKKSRRIPQGGDEEKGYPIAAHKCLLRERGAEGKLVHLATLPIRSDHVTTAEQAAYCDIDGR